MNNIMSNIASQLGVKIEEKFKVEGCDYLYVFDYKGLHVSQALGNGMSAYDAFLKIATGERKIIKLSGGKLVPSEGDIYWCVNFLSTSKVILEVSQRTWEDSALDLVFFYSHNVFFSKEDAENGKQDFYQRVMDYYNTEIRAGGEKVKSADNFHLQERTSLNMKKDLLPLIARYFGLQMGEVFKVTRCDYLYKFTDKGLETKDPDWEHWVVADADELVDIILGPVNIVKYK